MMGTSVILVLVIVVLALLLAARVPVALALLASGCVGLISLEGFRFTELTLGRIGLTSSGRYIYIVIPFFLAMGVFIQYSSVGQSLFDVGQRILGRWTGGLAIGTIFACAAFGAVSGSSAATVLSVGRVAVAQMQRFGYSLAAAAGVVGAAGTLGVLIPPSIVLVIYGIITGESIGRMLIAGIIPGILSATVYGAAIFARAKRRPDLFGGIDNEGRESTYEPVVLTRKSFAGLFKVATLFIIVFVGIYFGFVTVVESAGLAALVALVILLFELVRSERSVVSTLASALRETMQLNGMVFALLVAAAVFTTFLVSGRYGNRFAEAMVGLPIPPILLLALFMLALIPLGMFLDPLSMMLITVPIMYPVVIELGFDGIWFGILVIKMIEVALVTPPFGMNAYILSGIVEDLDVETAFRGLLWFLPYDLVTLALLFAFPALATWLPSFVN